MRVGESAQENARWGKRAGECTQEKARGGKPPPKGAFGSPIEGEAACASIAFLPSAKRTFFARILTKRRVWI